jgi:isocitrate dehydrogenase
MEIMNKYNVSNKTICVKDAIRAINEGEFKITFEKVPPKEQKPVVINYRPKFEVGGNQVNQFKFTHTRFWSPRKMPDNLKKQYNTQKEKI